MEKMMEKIKKYINKERIKTFLTTFISAMIVHFSIYSLILTGGDTLLTGSYNTAYLYEASLRKIWIILYSNNKRKYSITISCYCIICNTIRNICCANN